MPEQRKPRPRPEQPGFKVATLNLRIHEYDDLAAKAAALGITKHKLSVLAFRTGLPQAIEQLRAAASN